VKRQIQNVKVNLCSKFISSSVPTFNSDRMNYLCYHQSGGENYNCFVQFKIGKKVNWLKHEFDQRNEFANTEATDLVINENSAQCGVLLKKSGRSDFRIKRKNTNDANNDVNKFTNA
jgi:hypothetical protein